MSTTRLAGASWTQLRPSPTVLIPLGSTEQHGPHLACGTDTVIAEAVAAAAAEKLGAGREATEVVLAPSINFGASGEHQGFPGTMSIGHEALAHLLIELIRSTSLWAGRSIIVNGHGGNIPTLRRVVPQLIEQSHAVAWLPAITNMRDAHAGMDETSLILALAPASVELSRAAVGNTAPITELMPQLRRGGLAAVSATGVLGDPTGANADHGRSLFDTAVLRATAAIRRAVVGSDGRLASTDPPAAAPEK